MNSSVLNEGYINNTVGVNEVINSFCCKIVKEIVEVIEEDVTDTVLVPGSVK